jgi:hypothetical protein
VWELLNRLLGKKPLAGTPRGRRRKTYSARSGYVYVYRYEGCRETGPERATEFVFEISADRKSFGHASVLLAPPETAEWEDQHHRLNFNERYAIAKMALFQAFDERADPRLMRHAIVVRRADAENILETLGID